MSGPAAPSRPARHGRARQGVTCTGLALAVVFAAACSSGGGGTAAGGAAGTERTPTTAAASPLADAVRPLPPAPITPEIPTAGPEPVALTIDALAVAAAPVRPVGVADNGEMEIPPVDEVGWYRFGSRPGAPGSAVLAAHVAYDGVDGVFRHLDDLGAGDEVVVALADGTSQGYVVTDVTQYAKTGLPDAVWARGGEPQLVLITCGGRFDDAAGTYEDNVVAFARPA